jgi:hypothetical protein
MGLMSDEKFEEFLQREAQAYNEPPIRVPRDEMFAAIQSARLAAPRTNGQQPKTTSPRFVSRLAWLGMAATLVIGVAIGKFALQKENAPLTASSPAAPADTSNRSYATAANAQLVRAEALLTAYGASGANPAMDKQLSSWARDILSNTRLLIDSPAAGDPARRKLLQDLEVVLVQMVQRAPTAGAAEERSHIERSIERTQMIPRLRSALPADRSNGI